MEQFYAEFSEDFWISENIPLPEKGIYCDVGCAWPDLRSNTAFLRKRGWHGLAIDGNPFWKHYWDETLNAKFINAIVSNETRGNFDTSGPPDMARMRDAGERVDCIPLEHILVAHGIEHINFLSLDCEGHEFNALLSMNLARHCPDIIVSEYNTAGIGEDFRVKDYLESAGYVERHRTVANLIFTR
jgi:FkbM family methyltransferase